MALQKHKGKLTYTETPMIRHGTFYVTDAADKEISTLQAKVDTLVELAKDFIVQNELQGGGRMEVAEYDTLKDAVFGCAEQE